MSTGLGVFIAPWMPPTLGDPLHYWEDVSGNDHSFLRPIEGEDRSAVANSFTAITGGATNTHVTAADFEEGSAATSLTAWVADGYDPSLEPGTGDYSFSLWYNEVTPDGFAYVLNNGNTSGSSEPGFTLYTANGEPRIRMEDVGAGTVKPTLSSGLGNILGDGWHHVVGTFDRSGVYSAPNTVSLYVDGVLANSLVLPDIDGNPYNLSNPAKQLRIGGREYADHNFEGYLDDIAIYQGVLSATDVTTLLAAPSVNADTITTAGVTPLAVYNFENNLFDGAQPGTIPDDFDGNPGTLYGGTAVDDAARGNVLGFDAGAKSGPTTATSSIRATAATRSRLGSTSSRTTSVPSSSPARETPRPATKAGASLSRAEILSSAPAMKKGTRTHACKQGLRLPPANGITWRWSSMPAPER